MITRAVSSQASEGRYDARRGGSQSGMRLYNERLVLSLIRRHGSLPKAEIARLTGLSAQTCSVIVKQLEADGLLRKEKPRRGRVGQPSIPFSLVPEGAYSIGLKIGRRSADVVLMDLLGRLVERRQQAYRYPDPEMLVEFAEGSSKDLEASLPAAARARIVGLGIAMPGEIWSWQREVGAPSSVLTKWRDFDVRGELAATSPWPVLVQNDATAACAAELTFGAGKTHADFLYLFVGSFIGGGIVMDGKLHAGRTGNAGAIGPMLVPDGRGGTQQLIQSASLFVLERQCEAAGFAPKKLWLEDSAWDEADTIVSEWIGPAAAGLAIAIISAMAVLDLEAVVIDGGFPPGIRRRLVNAVRKEARRLDRRGLSPFEIVEGSIGTQARAIGGATLPLLSNFAVDSELFLKEAG